MSCLAEFFEIRTRLIILSKIETGVFAGKYLIWRSEDDFNMYKCEHSKVTPHHPKEYTTDFYCSRCNTYIATENIVAIIIKKKRSYYLVKPKYED